MARSTGVWLDDVRVAEITTKSGLDIRLRYTAEAHDRFELLAPVLSCSLPLTSSRQNALPFFQGLLPEGHALMSMAANAGVAVNATYDLLVRYGRDVAGAIVISDDPPGTRASQAEVYETDALDQAVSALDDHPLDLRDDSELSIAGFQDKLLLVRTTEGQWARPVDGHPSTHILKRDHLRHNGIVDAEAAALRIANACGLTTITPQLVDLGGHRCLIVERFDRVYGETGVRRLHQEDLCQATGTETDGRGRQKYEAHGGPGFLTLAQLLVTHSEDPDLELHRLLQTLVFTVLIGNSDAHGKNLSLLHPTPETVTLAPLYDTVPTVLWPTLQTRAAMHIGGCTELPSVTLEAIHREVRRWPGAHKDRPRSVADAINDVSDAASHCGHEPLRDYIRQRADALIRTR